MPLKWHFSISAVRITNFMVSLYFLEVGINGTYFGTVAKNIFVFIIFRTFLLVRSILVVTSKLKNEKEL